MKKNKSEYKWINSKCTINSLILPLKTTNLKSKQHLTCKESTNEM